MATVRNFEVMSDKVIAVCTAAQKLVTGFFNWLFITSIYLSVYMKRFFEDLHLKPFPQFPP